MLAHINIDIWTINTIPSYQITAQYRWYHSHSGFNYVRLISQILKDRCNLILSHVDAFNGPVHNRHANLWSIGPPFLLQEVMMCLPILLYFDIFLKQMLVYG